jgi:hypothetical protein
MLPSWKLRSRRRCPWTPAGPSYTQPSCLTPQVCTNVAVPSISCIHLIARSSSCGAALSLSCTGALCKHSAGLHRPGQPLAGAAVHATVTAGSGGALPVRWTADAGGAWTRSQVRRTADVVLCQQMCCVSRAVTGAHIVTAHAVTAWCRQAAKRLGQLDSDEVSLGSGLFWLCCRGTCGSMLQTRQRHSQPCSRRCRGPWPSTPSAVLVRRHQAQAP